MQLDDAAMHKHYLVRPSGSPDAWNKEKRIARASQRTQKYLNHPNIDQEKLIRFAEKLLGAKRTAAVKQRKSV